MVSLLSNCIEKGGTSLIVPRVILSGNQYKLSEDKRSMHDEKCRNVSFHVCLSVVTSDFLL